MTIPPMYFTWNAVKGIMVPRHSRLAEQSFTANTCYRLGIVAEHENRRSTEQNNKMWAMLGDIAEQKEHYSRKLSPDEWKVLFLAEAGFEQKLMPSLDGERFVSYFQSSSRLSKQEMAELLECIQAWGDRNGVKFKSDQGVTWHEPRVQNSPGE